MAMHKTPCIHDKHSSLNASVVQNFSSSFVYSMPISERQKVKY